MFTRHVERDADRFFYFYLSRNKILCLSAKWISPRSKKIPSPTRQYRTVKNKNSVVALYRNVLRLCIRSEFKRSSTGENWWKVTIANRIPNHDPVYRFFRIILQASSKYNTRFVKPISRHPGEDRVNQSPTETFNFVVRDVEKSFTLLNDLANIILILIQVS